MDVYTGFPLLTCRGSISFAGRMMLSVEQKDAGSNEEATRLQEAR
jgi:hypothetical protein